MKEDWGYLVVIGLLVWCAWHVPDNGPQVVKSYLINCQSWSEKDGNTCHRGDWRHQWVDIYTLWPEQQRVVVQTDNLLSRYDKCVIFDKDDWHCDYSSEAVTRTLASAGGEITDTEDQPWEKRVGALHYYALRLLDLF